MRDADRGCPPRASPLADQTLRLGWLGGRPGTFDSVCRRVVLDIRGRVRTGVGVGWCFDEARPHARHKRAYESEHLGPGAEPAKHNDLSVRVAFRPVNPVPTRGPAVASPTGIQRLGTVRLRDTGVADPPVSYPVSDSLSRRRQSRGPVACAERALPAASSFSVIDLVPHVTRGAPGAGCRRRTSGRSAPGPVSRGSHGDLPLKC